MLLYTNFQLYSLNLCDDNNNEMTHLNTNKGWELQDIELFATRWKSRNETICLRHSNLQLMCHFLKETFSYLPRLKYISVMTPLSVYSTEYVYKYVLSCVVFLFHICFLPLDGKFHVVAVQLLSHVWLFLTPCTAAHQAPRPLLISQDLLKFMSIE